MFTKPFKQISKSDVDIAGGKGASLGEMTNAKIPVPPGFVILTLAFEQFLRKNDLDVKIDATMKKVNPKNINLVDRASTKIRDLISSAELPADARSEVLKEFQKLKSQNSKVNPPASGQNPESKNNFYVAVRSSATAEDLSVASWAGELESYLNVTEKNLLESVKKCWSSLFTPRAIFYRFEKKLDKQKVSVAVVVQKMVQSEISGICFTVHPVTKDRNQMVIEAGYGLGEAIVGGMITPDTYIIKKLKTQMSPKQNKFATGQANVKTKDKNLKPKEEFEILEVNVSEQKMMIVRSKNGTQEKDVPKEKQGKQKLTGKQIIKLAEICAEIENHYKNPQDIEWAFENNKFYIVQSRPITTL